MPPMVARSLVLLGLLNIMLCLATPVLRTGSAVEKQAGGFTNSVYFTNWFVNSRLAPFALGRLFDRLVGGSMVETTSPLIFLLLKSPMFCILS